MKRIQDQEKGPREKKVEPKPAAPVAPIQVKTTAVQPVKRAPAAARQISEDDEIAKIKRENKAAGTSQAVAAVVEAERPAERTTSILKKAAPPVEETISEVSQVPRIQPSFVTPILPSVFDLYVFWLFLSLRADIFRRHKHECRQQQQSRPFEQRVKVRRRVQVNHRRWKLRRFDHVWLQQLQRQQLFHLHQLWSRRRNRSKVDS